MSKMKFDQSLLEGQHQNLKNLAGHWKGIAKVWFGPDELVDESEVSATFSSILGGRFLQHVYQGTFQGKPIEGLAIFGYHLLTEKFQCTWVDSFHMGTGILFSENKESGQDLSATGSYATGYADEPFWGWRTTLDIISENEIVITAYNISPSGEEVKATEASYKRII